MDALEDLDPLWEPLRVGGLTMPNRVLMSAHNPLHAPDRYAAYLAERARGGPGLIVMGAVPVHPSSGAAGAFVAGWSESLEADYARLASAVHTHGGRLVSQLYHNGHQHAGDESLDHWHALLAPSAVASPAVGVQPKAMELEDIEEVTAAFVYAAACAQAGGVDGVEVHAAHGYLLHEFLSPLTNHRTDSYGGSAENRARFTLEVARAIRARCGDGYTIGLKLAFDELIGPAGITPAVAAENLRVLHAAGVFDYVSISSGNYHTIGHLIAPMASDRIAHFAEHGAAAKAVVGDLPVMVTGAVKRLDTAAGMLRAGQADVVGMSRGFIADPEIVRKGRSGRAGEVRRCVGSNQGCWGRLVRGLEVTCTVNPMAGRELRWGRDHLPGPTATRRVLVVGGGPAGMKAAEAAAQRGHDVTLLERDDELGGQLRLARALPHRAAWGHLVEDLAGSLDRLGVDVRLGRAATAATPAELGADVTVVAAGAAWDRTGFTILRPDHPAIPGVESEHVLTLVDAIADPGACGPRVVIVDDNGDYSALGLAELLADAGRDVEIVTAHPQIGARVMGTTEYGWAAPRLARAGVVVSTAVFVDAIAPGRVTLADVWTGAPREIAADSVVLSMTRSSDDELYLALKAAGGDVVRAGDCVAPRQVDDATYEGMTCGLSL